MADQHTSRAALYAAIEKATGEVNNYDATVAAPALRELAYAWRALVGGTQPGASVVVKE